METANSKSENAREQSVPTNSFSKDELKRFQKAQYMQEYYWKNRSKWLARVKRYDYAHRRISTKLYNSILGNQLGVCAICCKTNPNGQILSIDHDHKTGKVRGLLCIKCNSAVGILENVGFPGFEAYLEIA